MSAVRDSTVRALGLEGKTAIVTGASRGIGEAIVRAFVDLRVNVVGVSRKFSDDWESRLNSGGGGGTGEAVAVAVAGDVSEFHTAERAVEACLRNFGRLDILVNNAGIVISGTILDFKMEDWDRQMDVNLKGAVNFAKVAAQEMVKQDTHGRIINISSVAGFYYEVGLLAYSASKGAITSFTRGLAVDLATHKILVNSIAPGWIDTQMGTGSLKQQQIEAVNERIPLGYIGSPAEIAGVAVFLASDLSTYVTGQTIVVDGGETVDGTIRGIQY